MQVLRIAPSEIECLQSEVLRYMGVPCGVKDEVVLHLVQKAISTVTEKAIPQAVWHTWPLALNDEVVHFADVSIASRDLTRFFTCHGTSCRVVLLAATLGPKVDAAIRRASVEDAAYSCALQAAGASMVEAFIDRVCVNICQALCVMPTTRRYSPGYGDVPLEVQRVFFRLLECGRIGLTLMDTLVMAPEKSVTAFLGTGAD